MFKFINNFNYFKNILSALLKTNEKNIYPLGRWCHVNMPKCDYNVVIKKIDMANRDNNFCIKPKNFNKN